MQHDATRYADTTVPFVHESPLTADELRELYVVATLSQRYRVARDRIDHPSLGPSLLVNVVSALEGFARAIAVKAAVKRGEAVESAYNQLRNLGPVRLIAEHVCPAYHIAPVAAFGEVAWNALPEAVRFRNLLVHEATYLNGATCDALISAAAHVLSSPV